MSQPWYQIQNAAEIPSPALLVYPDRVVANIERLIELAGGVDRLYPHTKTHKMAEVVQMHLARGIKRFKCATLAEAEMLAEAGASEILMAYQPVGPNIERLAALAVRYPTQRFGAVSDTESIMRALSVAAGKNKVELDLWLDLDPGMHRTGIGPGPAAKALYHLISLLPHVRPGGIHAYDGHLRDPDVERRQAQADSVFAEVLAFRRELEQDALSVPHLVMAGSPSFPVHAHRPEVELSPGTYVFWDAGYHQIMPAIGFQPAAILLSRVLSKPGKNRICLDLGHKAVAAENPLDKRVQFLNLKGRCVGHSEEHLVVESEHAADWQVGDVVYSIPWHVCPTVALHERVGIVEQAQVQGYWEVGARRRTMRFESP